MARFSGLFTLLVGLAALAGAIWWLQRPPAAADAEAPRPPFVLPVTLAELERDTLEPSVLLTGTVRSPARAELAFEVDGVLVSLDVREVDRFEAGRVVAKLRATDEELALAQAEADARYAERELDLLLAGTRAEELDRLVAELAERAAAEDLARTDLKRGRQLVEDKVISQADLDEREATLAGAVARKEAKAAELAEARAGARDEDVAIARARVAQAHARVETARGELAKTEIVAPSAGIVLRRLAAVGDYLAAGTPVLEVIDLAEIQVELEIPGRAARDIAADSTVSLTADDLPGWSLATTLDARAPAADEASRNFTGYVRFDAEDEVLGVLEPGMFVRARVALAPLRDALVAPSDAIRRVAEGTLVARAVPGPAGADGRPSLVAELVPVQVLAVEGTRSAVAALDPALDPPLAAGDKLVVTGVDRAFPGAPLLPPRGGGPPGGAGDEGGPSGEKPGGAKPGGAEGAE